MALKYEILKTAGKSRLGKLYTKHGVVDTPAFMPVGTCGTVKAMMPESVAATGAQILLGNTYHLMLRPGSELVAKMGGLHKFMNWNKPILTDSGGFQVMSLTGLRKLTEEGVIFSSHIDGKKYLMNDTYDSTYKFYYRFGILTQKNNFESFCTDFSSKLHKCRVTRICKCLP